MSFLVDFYNIIFFKPLLNALVFLTSVVPFHDLGVAVILLTLIVRTIIFPFTHRSVQTQAKMRAIEPHLKKIRDEHKNNQAELAKKTMELYKEHGVSPFSGCLLLLIQLPILIAMYRLFIEDISGASAHLYSFVHFPEYIRYSFFGLVDMTKPNIVLAVIVGLSQYIQMKLVMPPKKAFDKNKKERPSFKEEFSQSMATQSVYIFPFLIFFISIRFPSAVALYWTTSNVFATVHEGIVRKKTKKYERENERRDPGADKNIDR